MALRDVTDRTAVFDAVAEFDRIGRDAFLAKYRFGAARSYFVEHDGKLYDSKPIVAAAHGYQHGDPLPNNFSGGEATVAVVLTRLGFAITRPTDPPWTIDVGTIATRAEIKNEYGGSTLGGIQPSRTSKNILIYTDPEEGKLRGYNYDGADSNEPGIFYYTGEGQRGDQQMTAGNKAILEHAASGRALRLFEAVDGKQRRGGKLQRYVGQYGLDLASPFRRLPAPDVTGNTREVIVFRLLALNGGVDEPAAKPTSRSTVVFVESENNTVEEFDTAPTTGGTARRVEAALVRRFEQHLRSRGLEPIRARVTPAGERTLVTDTYVESTNALYEAKSNTDRATIRLAIGQLLDYLRFIPDAQGSLLLPTRPSDDLVSLIQFCGLGLVHEHGASWTYVTPTSDPPG